ncbi:Uncharacterized protein dnl_09240 [Desulfonema limicola]|uniref:NurA domain-containing protein n=1 Tax=Desulfonema limicola TaxID=45656 RepID=A0A975B4L9_9BACT|nr:hypothetical protein [Desulfonema limicola]QTA78694.1 Uncharacterized protein dnl_09240 [Desulfonema limicola]
MKSTNLAQTLAIESQLRLPGSAGRLLKQIRDIEAVAPIFRDAGLIKPVSRPAIINLNVSGIATHSCIKKALGGFIYASAAVCTDIKIENNQVSTLSSDSVSELDDIDFEAQRKRLDLIEIRQAYQLAQRLLEQNRPSHMILLDTPLFLSREMAPLKRNVNHLAEYEKTRTLIERFWNEYREQLFPWNPSGPVLASIIAQRFSAIVSIARQDLRTVEGRKHILLSDGFSEDNVKGLAELEKKLSGIGDTRFINGILSGFTRTIAFRMTERESRMEPEKSVEYGVIGFHFKGGRTSQIQMVQLAGDEPDWNRENLDIVAWRLMILDMQSRLKSSPLPQLLGYQQLKMLDQFAQYYRQGLNEALKKNEVEETWLSGLDE